MNHLTRSVALLALLAVPLAAQDSQDTGWTITSFDAAYTINADRTISVVEQIDVDFGSLQKHGIYRDIPITYRKTLDAGMQVAAGKVKVDIDRISVTDGTGRELGLKVTRGTEARLRIGDADRTVSGPQRYILKYRLERGLGFFEDHDELYWQVTGTRWPVPILATHATVTLGVTATSGSMPWDAWCYAGWPDSNDNSRCQATASGTGTWEFSTGRLDPGEGLTMVASFPKGIIAAPTETEAILESLGVVWPLGVPMIMLGFMTWLWRTRGREPEQGSVVPYWKVPKDLRPGPAGTLWDQSSDMNDIVATLLDLTVRGFVRITEVQPDGLLGGIDQEGFTGKLLQKLGITQTDWELERINASGEGELAHYETLVLDGVFAGGTTRRMSDLNNEFYTQVPKIHTALYETVVAEGLFTGNPQKTRVAYGVLGVVIIAVGVAIGSALGNGVLVAGGVLSGIIVLAFARAMPARTLKGAKQWEQLRGLEEYVRRAEKLELEMSQGPERTTQLFEELLPFAVALRVSDIWVKQFGPILASNPPTWYVGGTPGHFNVNNFSNGLASFQTAATRTMGSSPGSSSGGGGGGSVGGGGGGGGGGSW
ncbi:MAG TPA: DUF2207 domain-containing protein [Gemmatimonadales bacterium]|nr:DUF2207 domain-containing protein [Gemmatimonadales bacterium]